MTDSGQSPKTVRNFSCSGPLHCCLAVQVFGAKMTHRMPQRQPASTDTIIWTMLSLGFLLLYSFPLCVGSADSVCDSLGADPHFTFGAFAGCKQVFIYELFSQPPRCRHCWRQRFCLKNCWIVVELSKNYFQRKRRISTLLCEKFNAKYCVLLFERNVFVFLDRDPCRTFLIGAWHRHRGFWLKK